MKIILLTNQMNTPESPLGGTFNLPRMHELVKMGHVIEIISPVSITPPQSMLFPLPKMKQLVQYVKRHLCIPKKAIIEGFIVHYPKFFALPRKISWYAELPFLHFFAGIKIAKVIREFQADMVLGSWLHPHGPYTKYVKGKFNIPFIALAEGSDLLIYPSKYNGIKRINKLYNKYVDALSFGSYYIKNNLDIDFPFKNNHVIQNGFDYRNYITDVRIHKKSLRDIKPLRIVSVGSLSELKGHDILLDGMRNLPKHFELNLRGDGPLKPEYKKYVETFHLQERVKFLPRLSKNKLKALYESCDLYCQPSHSESLPAAPMEAMACGLPVVAARVGGLPEVIIEGFNGYLFEPGSVSSLREKLELAQNTQWNSQEISDWVVKNWSWKVWAKKFNKLIMEVEGRYDRHN